VTRCAAHAAAAATAAAAAAAAPRYLYDAPIPEDACCLGSRRSQPCPKPPVVVTAHHTALCIDHFCLAVHQDPKGEAPR
jgi:hypothetical protein